MRPENWLCRRVKPIAVAVGITVPVNFQVLRRTFATNAQGHGNAKDVQTHLRHTDIATTLDVYTQPIDANVLQAGKCGHYRRDDEQTGAGAVRTPAEKS
jgi:integrase